MPPPDRLSELQRQRALVQQHLASLDREIQAAQTADRLAWTSTPATAILPVASTPAPLSVQLFSSLPPTAVGADAETIIGQYRTDEKSLTRDVRKGCLFYAFLAFVLLATGVFGLYFLLRH
jgi:hypothetical protein